MPYPPGFSTRTSGLYPSREDLFAEEAEELRLAHNRSIAAEAHRATQDCRQALAKLAEWEGEAAGAEALEELTTALDEAIAGLRRAVVA